MLVDINERCKNPSTFLENITLQMFNFNFDLTLKKPFFSYHFYFLAIIKFSPRIIVIVFSNHTRLSSVIYNNYIIIQ